MDRYFDPYRTIIRGMERIFLAFPEEIMGDDQLLSFKDHFYAAHFMRRLIPYSDAMTKLRHLLVNFPFELTVSQMDDHAIIDTIVDLMMNETIQAVKLTKKWHSWEIHDALRERAEAHKEKYGEEKPPPIIASRSVLPSLKWVQYKVVDDETGVPIPKAAFNAKLEDGTVKELSSFGGGMIRMDELEQSGPVNLFSEKPTELFMGDALLYLGVGETPKQSKEKEMPVATCITDQTKARTTQKKQPVIKAKTHKVKTGETLETIAKNYGMSALDLAYFNWGTQNMDDVNAFLPEDVGCTRQSEDGKSWIFDETDSPGTIYIPDTWDNQELNPNQMHTIRVTTPRRYLRFHYHIDMDAQNTQDDMIILESHDGSWKYEMKVADAAELKPDWVELCFPKPPENLTYRMMRDFKDGNKPVIIFENYSLKQLYGIEPEYDKTA